MTSKILDSLFDRTVTGLSKAMDLTSKRNNTIIANITNAETPLYRSVDFTFADELNRAFGGTQAQIQQTNAKHMDLSESSSAHTVPDYSGATKPDGNNVDLDIQMGRLVLNSGEYMNAAKLMKRQLGFIRTVIRSAER